MTWRVLTHAFDFRGRAGREEYWWYAFFVWSVSILAALWDINQVLSGRNFYDAVLLGASTLTFLFFLVPNLSVAVRRLHDVGRSGFALLWAVVPLAGPIMLFGLFMLPSDTNTNRFGTPPSGLRPTTVGGMPKIVRRDSARRRLSAASRRRLVGNPADIRS